MDVLILGAGLIGLASACELAKRGAQVCVLDLREPAKAASWAGAGMLAPYTESLASRPLEDLCATSLALYPGYVRALRELTGVDARLRLSGLLHTACDEEEMRMLRARVDELAARGIHARWLDSTAACATEPTLNPAVLGASVVEEEGQVENRLLGRALLAACDSLGVRIVTQEMIELEADERRVRGVRTLRGFIPAQAVVNAAGAWAGRLDGVPRSARVPVEPVKGQMLALGMPRGLVRRVVWFAGGYAVPREDGRLLIGATVEQAGFDLRVTAEGMRSLLDATLTALPSLRSLAVVETWAGLRPGSADGLPYIGASHLEGYFIATGHGRNGILLTPITASLIADAVEGKSMPPSAEPFSPRRLLAGAVA